MNKTSNLLWGMVLIIAGLIFGLNALEITHINIFFNGWWTLFIIIPSFIDLFKEKDKTGNIIGLTIGIFLLLACNNIINFDLIIKLIVPISLIIGGFSFIFKDAIKGQINKEIKKLNKNNLNEYYATFGSQDLSFRNEKFEGANTNAVFGEITLDLKDALIEKNVIINASSIFGSTTIVVPDDINIKIVSTPIFGGVSDERKIKTKESKLTIYINATCIFGGIDIK